MSSSRKTETADSVYLVAGGGAYTPSVSRPVLVLCTTCRAAAAADAAAAARGRPLCSPRPILMASGQKRLPPS